MYFVENSDYEKYKLNNPVAAVGEFVQAECKTYRSRATPVYPDYMRITYAYKAPDGKSYDAAGAPIPVYAQPSRVFNAMRDVEYRSYAECDAALPVMRAQKAPHPVWYESGNPHAATTSLDPPDSIRFVWMGLAATLPLALYAWLLGVLRRRQEQVAMKQASDASTASAHDHLPLPLRFVKFTQTPLIKKMFVFLIFALIIGGFVGQFLWYSEKERAGKERVRAAAAQSVR